YGFSPTGRSWLPQPPSWARYARDRQVGVAGSTYELYRAALGLRRSHGLGAGAVCWRDLGPEVLAFQNGDLLVVVNLAATPVSLPVGWRVVLASAGEPSGAGEG